MVGLSIRTSTIGPDLIAFSQFMLIYAKIFEPIDYLPMIFMSKDMISCKYINFSVVPEIHII